MIKAQNYPTESEEKLLGVHNKITFGKEFESPTTFPNSWMWFSTKSSLGRMEIIFHCQMCRSLEVKIIWLLNSQKRLGRAIFSPVNAHGHGN